MLKGSPVLRKLFEERETSELMSELALSDEGGRFLAEFRTYLDEFGWRTNAFELSDPTWREDPVIPLNTLQGYIGWMTAATLTSGFERP